MAGPRFATATRTTCAMRVKRPREIGPVNGLTVADRVPGRFAITCNMRPGSTSTGTSAGPSTRTLHRASSPGVDATTSSTSARSLTRVRAMRGCATASSDASQRSLESLASVFTARRMRAIWSATSPSAAAPEPARTSSDATMALSGCASSWTTAATRWARAASVVASFSDAAGGASACAEPPGTSWRSVGASGRVAAFTMPPFVPRRRRGASRRRARGRADIRRRSL